MNPDLIEEWITQTFDHVVPKQAWGETSYFVNPQGALPSGAYFATIKQKNGDNDRASGLDREGIFRLNIGPGRTAYEALFGPPPARPAKGEIIEGAWNFANLDTVMPHPIYGWMGWVSVLNPSRTTFDICKPLLNQAHAKALASVTKRLEKAV